MIAFVRGQVAAVTLNSAVLDVGGIGLELMCTPGTLATLRTGQTATLPTSMVVREDSLTIFGFLDEDEKVCFELVQTASGVGPKLAQAILACLAPDELRVAVASDDTKTLTRVSGIGQKGAQRIILELKDRLGAPVGAIEQLEAAQIDGSRDGGWSGSMRLDVEVCQHVGVRGRVADRHGQPARFEKRRMDVLGEVARLSDRTVQVLRRLLEQGSRRRRVLTGHARGELEVGRERHQVLLHTLVQLPLESLSLDGVALGKSPARCAQVDHLGAKPVELS